MFGSDGTNDPAFKFPGSYVSNFAPDISRIPSKKALVDEWKKANPGGRSAFGPPDLRRVTGRAAGGQEGMCRRQRHDREPARRAPEGQEGPSGLTILGGSFPFSKKTNDPLNGKF